MNQTLKVVRGIVYIRDQITLYLPIVRPLTATEQADLKCQLETYYADTHEMFGVNAQGQDFISLTPSPRTERDANVSALRDVAAFLAGPGVTIEMVCGAHVG